MDGGESERHTLQLSCEADAGRDAGLLGPELSPGGIHFAADSRQVVPVGGGFHSIQGCRSKLGLGHVLE